MVRLSPGTEPGLAPEATSVLAAEFIWGLHFTYGCSFLKSICEERTN